MKYYLYLIIKTFTMLLSLYMSLKVLFIQLFPV